MKKTIFVAMLGMVVFTSHMTAKNVDDADAVYNQVADELEVVKSRLYPHHAELFSHVVIHVVQKHGVRLTPEEMCQMCNTIIASSYARREGDTSEGDIFGSVYTGVVLPYIRETIEGHLPHNARLDTEQ